MVSLRPKLIKKIPTAEIARTLSPNESRSVTELFCGFMKENRYVRKDSRCPSLGSIKVVSKKLMMEVVTRGDKDGKEQLRCSFMDSSGSDFDLPVVAVDINKKLGAVGIKALNKEYEGKDLHVRIGLAGPMGDGRAFVMVNGIAAY